MAERKFTLAFRPTQPSEESTPLTVVLSPVDTKKQTQARYNHLAVVPYHATKEISSTTPADCYLQLWELDRFKVDRYLSTEESDLGPLDNRLVATFPGVIEVVGGQYKFRPVGDPVFVRHVVEPTMGLVQVKMKPATDTSEITYTVPLPEYEGVLELAGVVRPNSTDRNYATETEIPPHQVRNVEAALRRQLAEWGGFSVAFVANYSTGSPITDLENNWTNNNAEFPRQGEDMIDVMPTFIHDGRVKMGFHFTNDYRLWADIIDELRSEVANLLGIPSNHRPKVSLLEIYCHGVRSKVHIDAAGYNGAGSLRTNNCDDFISRLSEHLTDHIVVPLFACNTARSTYDGGNGTSDPRFCRRYIGDELGADGLAWTLQRKLQRAGHKHATVWGHTIAAHTTRNPFLGVYCAQGSADFGNLARRDFRLSAAGVQSYRNTFAFGADGISDSLYRERLHNANCIRTISLQNGLYLPWAWNGGTDATAATPGFRQGGYDRARAVYNELAGKIAGAAVEQEEFVLSRDRRFITGLRPVLTNAQVSRNFTYTDYSAHFPPHSLSVRLARMVQLLRDRSNKGMSINGLDEVGQGAWVKAAPHSAAAITAIETSANNMLADDLFTSVRREGDRLHVSVSGLLYDASGTYIVGRHASEPNPLVAANLPYSAFERLATPMRLHGMLAGVMSSCMERVNQTLIPKAIKDNGETLVFTGGSAPGKTLGEAEVYVALGTIARASLAAGFSTDILISMIR